MGDVKPPDADEAAALLSNWHLLSAAFSLNHACTSTLLIYSSTLLDAQVGYSGSALFYVFTCLSTLFVGVPSIAVLGQRLSLFVAMVAYSVVVGCFAVACALPEGSLGQWLAHLPASCLGGLAAGILWTAYGGYLSRSADVLAESAEGGRQSATARHSAIFAVYYLVGEVILKGVSSAALHYNVRPWVVFLVFFGLGLAAAFACRGLRDLPSAARQEVQAKPPSPLLAAVAIWPDPVIWCLAPTNLAFGFAAAFMNGYVNVTYTKPQLGEEFVGLFAMATALLAAVLSYVFGLATVRMGTKGPVMLLGSVCFVAVPILVLAFSFEGWGYWLFLPYAIQGAERAVYESTNKAIFADFFTSARSEGAFANQMMQSTFSFAICFFCSATLSRDGLALMTLLFSVAVFPGYLLAVHLRGKEHAKEDARRDPDVEDSGAPPSGSARSSRPGEGDGPLLRAKAQ